MRPAGRAWVTLGAGVIAYDWIAPKGETLSEGADRGIEAHPVLVRLGVLLVAVHVANAVPPRWDPLHRVFASIPYSRRV